MARGIVTLFDGGNEGNLGIWSGIKRLAPSQNAFGGPGKKKKIEISLLVCLPVVRTTVFDFTIFRPIFTTVVFN